MIRVQREKRFTRIAIGDEMPQYPLSEWGAPSNVLDARAKFISTSLAAPFGRARRVAPRGLTARPDIVRQRAATIAASPSKAAWRLLVCTDSGSAYERLEHGATRPIIGQIPSPACAHPLMVARYLPIPL